MPKLPEGNCIECGLPITGGVFYSISGVGDIHGEHGFVVSNGTHVQQFDTRTGGMLFEWNPPKPSTARSVRWWLNSFLRVMGVGA